VSWNVKGQIRVRVTKIAGSNALVNGVFFDNSPKLSGTSTSGKVVSGSFQLHVTGETGQRFDIFASDDLTHWTKISTITLPAETYDFSDSTSQGQPRRFYRAVAVP
jgi:hypothetical protein